MFKVNNKDTRTFNFWHFFLLWSCSNSKNEPSGFYQWHIFKQKQLMLKFKQCIKNNTLPSYCFMIETKTVKIFSQMNIKSARREVRV